MSVLLIILGLAACSYETELGAGVGACLIIGGILYALFAPQEAKPVKRQPQKVRTSTSDEPYTGRTHGDTYYGVYTRDGDYVREEDLRETIDGDFIAPSGEIFVRDSDGEYSPYHV